MKTLKLFLLFSLSTFTISCTKVDYPKPKENPVYFTSEAQTKNVYIKNLYAIETQYPEQDNVYHDNVQTADKNPEMIITSEWVTISEGGYLPKKTVKIEVKENTSTESRTYNLILHSHLKQSVLQIIQAGTK